MAPLHGQQTLADDPFDPNAKWKKAEAEREAREARDANDTPPAKRLRPQDTDTAIKTTFSRDESGNVSGSFKLSAKALAAIIGLLCTAATALGYFGHGEAPAAKHTDNARIEAIESRMTALESAVSRMDGKLDVLIQRK